MIRPEDRSRNDGDPTDEGVDRGQLLLVGAVSIALIFLGLVVVFNTVLFTDSTNPTEPLESGEEARSFKEEVRNDTRMILVRVANETGADSGVAFTDPAEENITRYSVMMSTSYADTGPVYAAVKNVQVDGAGVLSSCGTIPIGSDDICAKVTVVYETSEFEYRDRIFVVVEAP